MSAGGTGSRSAPLAWGLAALLVCALAGEGGASPGGLLAVHLVLAALLLLALAEPGLGGRSPGRLADPPAAAFALFLFLAVLGAAKAAYGFAAYLVLLELAAFTATAWLAARCGPSLGRRLALPLLAAASFEGGLALYQRLVLGEPRPAGTFLNPNHLAGWVVAVLLLALAGKGGEPPGALRWGLAVVALPAVALSGSRGALLVGAVAGTAYVVWKLAPSLSRRARRRLLAGGAALLVAAVVLVAVRFRRPDPFSYYRLRIWRASVGALAADPLWGTRPGQFAVAAENLNFPVETGPLRYERHFSSTHSDWLRAPCEFGWPAALALLAAALLVAREAARRRETGLVVGPAAALVALAAQAGVDDLSQRPALYLLAAVLIGSLASRPATTSRRTVPMARTALAVALVGFVVVGDVAPYVAWRESASLPRGRLDPEQRRALDRILAWNPLHPEPWLRLSEHLSKKPGGLDAPSYARAREAAETAVRLQPAAAQYRLGLARVEARACSELFRDVATRERALRHYREAMDRARHDPWIPLEAADFLLAASDPSGARRMAERALRIEPEAIPPRLFLAEAILDKGDPGAAREAKRILDGAEEAARRWADYPRESTYARRLLHLDRPGLARLRKRLAPADRVLGPVPDDPGRDR